MKKTAFIGFDGYIDQILRPISSVQGRSYDYFTTISDMGQYIIGKGGKSCSIQLDRVSSRLGGNGPIFGRTLKQMGINVKLAGMFGADTIHPLFAESFSPEELCSFSDPMETLALEFEDGKVMMCPTAPDLKKPLKALLQGADRCGFSLEDALASNLLAFLNWGEVYFMQTLWEEIFCEYFSQLREDTVKDERDIIFFDPADVSSHDETKIRAMLNTMETYGTCRYAILSVNENEALQIGKRLFGASDCGQIIRLLQQTFRIPEIVVHSNKVTRSLVHGKEYLIPTLHVDHPVISTGAGDNFNAGYCYAKLKGWAPEKCIRTAHRAASFYISHGYPVSGDVLEPDCE